MRNNNLQRHIDAAAKLEERLATRLPRSMRRVIAASKRKLWWGCPVYRRTKPALDADGHTILRQLDDDGTQVTIAGATVPSSRFITQGEQQLLHRLITEHKPKLAVEIGLANGYSTLALLQGCADTKCGKLLSIDPFAVSHSKGCGLMNVRRAGLDGFHLWWEKDSQFALPQLAEAETRIDFAFIDGNHMFDYTLVEFSYLDRMLRKDGIMAFHDYTYPAVRAAVNFVEANFPYTVVPSAERNVRVLRKDRHRDHPWYYWTPFVVPQIRWTSQENREFCD